MMRRRRRRTTRAFEHSRLPSENLYLYMMHIRTSAAVCTRRNRKRSYESNALAYNCYRVSTAYRAIHECIHALASTQFCPLVSF